MSPTSRRSLAVVIAGLLLLTAPDLIAAEDEAGGHGLLPTIAKLFNFGLLVGILVYFLKAPIVRYLADRTATVRRELVEAQTLRQTAQGQLGDVERRIAALPGELEALAARGRDELARERDRLAATTAREREKLVEHTRREIDRLGRIARRDLVEHAADRAMTLARAKIAAEITPDDQARLVDRYTAEVRS
jgi:F-type H+-transporting ATPase subunit b